MRIRLAVPQGLGSDDTAGAIDAALEAVTRGTVPQLEAGALPTFATALRAGRFRWKPEPPGDEHFDSPQTVLKRGWGDCDDLAPWYAASLRATGVDPEASAYVRPVGPGKWHAVVRRGDGRTEDPSRAAGMGQRAPAPRAPTWRGMFGAPRLALAAHPWRGGWAGRVDVPAGADAVSGIATGRTPAAAVCGALGVVGYAPHYGEVDPDDMLRMAAMYDLLSGVSEEDVADALAQQDAVGFLPALLPAAMSLAAPMLSKILPGQKGAPAPAAAPSGGGGGGMAPGTTMTVPGGPIIVRF